MSEVHSETLKEIVGRLVRGMQPDSIYLFGSQARGETDPGSDIDLLLILPDSDLPRHKREAISYDLLWDQTTPVDVIVLTKAEFQRGCHVKSSLPSRVRAEGKMIYG